MRMKTRMKRKLLRLLYRLQLLRGLMRSDGVNRDDELRSIVREAILMQMGRGEGNGDTHSGQNIRQPRAMSRYPGVIVRYLNLIATALNHLRCSVRISSSLRKKMPTNHVAEILLSTNWRPGNFLKPLLSPGSFVLETRCGRRRLGLQLPSELWSWAG
jgi:hypothetical protein